MQECMPDYLKLAQNTFFFFFFFELGMYRFHIYEFLQTAVTEGVFCPAFHSCSISASRSNTSHGSKLSVDGTSSPKVTLERCARYFLFLI